MALKMDQFFTRVITKLISFLKSKISRIEEIDKYDSRLGSVIGKILSLVFSTCHHLRGPDYLIFLMIFICRKLDKVYIWLYYTDI